MTSGIYTITNVATGRRYVGSSKNIEQRWQQHRWALQAGRAMTERMRRDALILDLEAFAFEVIEHVDPDPAALVAAERAWIAHYLLMREGVYNVNLQATRADAAGPKPAVTTIKPCAGVVAFWREADRARSRGDTTQAALWEARAADVLRDQLETDARARARGDEAAAGRYEAAIRAARGA